MADWNYLLAPGRVDAFNFAEAKAELVSAATGAKQIAYDVSGLQFMCLPMIKLLYKTAVDLGQRGGRLALIGSTEKLKRQFLIYASLDPFLCLTVDGWSELAPQSGQGSEKLGELSNSSSTM